MSEVSKTNQLIVQATLTQIESIGYESISLRSLAKQVNLTTGAFYKHFASKDDLWQIVTIELSADISEQANAQIKASDSADKKLLSLAEFLLIQFRNEPHLMDFLFFNPVAQRVLSEPGQDFELLNLTMQIIDELVTQYSWINQQEFFIQIWSFIQGYGMLIKNKVTRYDSGLVNRTLDRLLKE